MNPIVGPAVTRGHIGAGKVDLGRSQAASLQPATPFRGHLLVCWKRLEISVKIIRHGSFWRLSFSAEGPFGPTSAHTDATRGRFVHCRGINVE